MTEEDLNIDYTLTISRKGKTISIDTLSNEEHTTTLMEDEVAYYILHSKKEYYLYDNDEIDADILKEELFEINEKDYTYGYEKINGKSYYYEEYEGITAFIMWLDYNEEESVIKTRFYFDGTNIAYIKTTIDNDEELLKIEFSDGIDNSLFEIPSDYAEI
jgi:hypothetical protein